MNRGDQMYLDRYSYCVCVPVRPATLFYGSINFITYALYTIMMVSSMNRQEPADGTYEYRYISRQANSLSITVQLFHATVAILLIYGVIKAKASYLMPFFGVQLFEFFFNLPSFLQSLYQTTHYNWDDGQENSWPPFRNQPSHTPLILNSNYKLFSPVFRLSHLCLQGFFLCVIWKCYRYLKLRELMVPINFPANVEANIAQTFVSSSVSMPPPDYESVTKSSPPPDYDSAIRSIVQTDPKADENLLYPPRVAENTGFKVDDISTCDENSPIVINVGENNCEQQTIQSNNQQQPQQQPQQQEQQDKLNSEANKSK